MQGYNLKDYSPMKLTAASLDDSCAAILEISRKPWQRASCFCFCLDSFWYFRLFLECYFNCLPSLSPRTRSWMQQWEKPRFPTAASPKRNGQRTREQASLPPSAAVNERGCCCQVSCEFETAAERTHCALTTQSGTAAARLPGTTGSIWHTDEFTHTRWKISGQEHRHDLNVVWSWKPIFN